MSINPTRTKITLSLAGVVAVLLAGWSARAWFEDFRSEQKEGLRKISEEIATSRREYTNRADTNAKAIMELARTQLHTQSFQIWAYQLERENRTLQRADGKSGLIVPEVGPTR
jgi:hypothetical protein